MLKVWSLLYRDKMQQAYEFALDKVGVDFNSYQVSRYNIAIHLILIFFLPGCFIDNMFVKGMLKV